MPTTIPPKQPAPLTGWHWPSWGTVLGYVVGAAGLIVQLPTVIPESTWDALPAGALAWRSVIVAVAGAILVLSRKPGAPTTATLAAADTELTRLRGASLPPPPIIPGRIRDAVDEAPAPPMVPTRMRPALPDTLDATPVPTGDELAVDETTPDFRKGSRR